MKLRLIFSVFFLLINLCVNAKIIVLNGLSHIHQSEAGETFRGTIQLKNLGDKAQAITVYQRDFNYNHKGETFYGPAGSMKRSNANWIIVNPVNLMLQPSETGEVIFEVRVPQNDSLKGTYWSTILVEPRSEVDTTAKSRGLSISTVLRYAIQIASNVGNDGTTGLNFLNVELENKDTVNFLLIDVENTGTKMMRSEMAVELFSPTGESLGVFRSERKRTYPGTSRRYIIELPDLKIGNYASMLIADSEDEEVYGVQLSLEVKDD